MAEERHTGVNADEREQANLQDRQPMTEEEMRATTVGELTPLTAPIEITPYDSQWPGLFDREFNRIRAALGDRAVSIEHVGSTSVPGLAAKPRIDILLVVPDSADEFAYVPDLEAAGYVLRIREPDWYEHRVFKGPDTDVNLHVFSAGCEEIDRMLLFRDWLRANDADRNLYERTKLELAARQWKYVQNYADAKTAVVEEIIARARGETSDGAALSIDALERQKFAAGFQRDSARIREDAQVIAACTRKARSLPAQCAST